MRKMMYDQALSIMHKNNVKLSHMHNVIVKEEFDSHSKKSFRGLEKAERFDHCSFYAKTIKMKIWFCPIPPLTSFCRYARPAQSGPMRSLDPFRSVPINLRSR